MMEDGNQWNKNLVDEIFWEEEAIIILSTPISQNGGEDKLLCGLTKKWGGFNQECLPH